MWVEETAARVELAPSDVSADGQSGSYSELEVGLGEICRTPEPGRHPATNLRHLPEARLNKAALRQTLSRVWCRQQWWEG